MNRDAFFEQIGRLIRSHNHGVAFARFTESLTSLSYVDQKAGQALLLLSSGYTRAVIRKWITSGDLNIREPEKSQLSYEPITSPLCLYAGAELIVKNYEEVLPVMKQNCFKDMVVASYASVLVFDEIERHSKQQSISTIPLLVREVTPVCLALLPEIEEEFYKAYQNKRTVEELRREGELLFPKMKLKRG